MPQDTVPLAPLPTPSTSSEGAGTAELAADLMKSFTPAAPAPTPAPATQEPAKKEDKPATPAPAPKTPERGAPAPAPAKDVDPDDAKLTASDLRRELKRLKESGTLTVKERDKQIGELQDRISGFEKRRYWTDQDLQLHEAATKRLSQLESELYSRDYATSPEYKSKYQDRFDEIWKEASQEILGMTVRFQDGVDEEQKPKYSERPATVKDLLAVVDAPVSERIAIAKRLFGDEKEPVLQWARDINSIRKEATKAIEEKRNGYASEITSRNQKFQEANQKLGSFVQQMTAHLEKTYPDIFSAPADKPELGDALKKGFQFVDESSAKMMDYDINTRAARAAVVRSMAGAFPRLLMDNNQLRARVKELETTLGKYEGTDPSNLGGAGGGAPAGSGDKGGGSDDLARELDALAKK